MVPTKTPRTLLVLMVLVALSFQPGAAQEPVSPADVLSLRQVTSAEISPDGEWIAYTVAVPRAAGDKAGSSYSELYLVSTSTREIRSYITGQVSIRSVSWRPDGSAIAFLMARGEGAKTQIWIIPRAGGEARAMTSVETGVSAYQWHPSGKKIGFISTAPHSKREKYLEGKGYGFVFYEENLKNRNLFIADLNSDNMTSEPELITSSLSVWSFEFAPGGNHVAVAASEKNLIDHSYMFQRIYMIDLKSKATRQLTQNEGKLGNYAFSPDGSYLAYAAALEQKDHAVSQAFVIPVKGGEAKNLTPGAFKGHVNWVGWKDSKTVLYRAAEGVDQTLNTVSRDGGSRTTILHSKESGLIFGSPSFTKTFTTHALICSTPEIPGDLYLWRGKGSPVRLTNVNPFLDQRVMGKQEVVSYRSRDGATIEGLLILPVGYKQGTSYPLVVLVHGGPESNYSNSWVTYYSTPGQVLAGKGYVVFYPNYRSSTGYGMEYAAVGYGDPAGREFDDLADGIEYLVQQGIADKNRVGMGGGSYGGYASAWFATYYTDYIKAACVFVGISNVVSKRGTTDIPFEELFVHSGKKLEDMWDVNLKRSPVYWAHQSKTATLILGGTADPRVHPSQSLELYRRMKMNDHPAVRLVQYPGEGHGNARQPGRIDVLHRVLDWYDWYVRDGKRLDGPMPPLDISDKYGLDLPD